MATSRTGTAAYQHWRRRVLARGRADGVTCCPSCGVVLDYEHGMRRNSAEPDHILPRKWGGQNVMDNGRVLCRRCNIRRGAGRELKQQTQREATTDFAW